MILKLNPKSEILSRPRLLGHELEAEWARDRGVNPKQIQNSKFQYSKQDILNLENYDLEFV